MSDHRVGIIMNGVTGRMGTNQHLMRSIAKIIEQGGVSLPDGGRIIPDPILVGRNSQKLEQLSKQSGVHRYTNDLAQALADPHNHIYFDAQTTLGRAAAVEQAIEAGKHVYCEKPVAGDTQTALKLSDLASRVGVKNGVVQDKLWLPGLVKLKNLIDTGFFGQILSLRGEFGYWVFEGTSLPSQRPSWNYKKEEGGGIILDMFCHWQYILEDLFGSINSISCLGATHIGERIDENGSPYVCTADDAAYGTFKIADGIIAHLNSSWTVRVRRDDLLVLQVDGTQGSAVTGLRRCFIQSYEQTPRPTWNPDTQQPINFYDDWTEVMASEEFDNAFKIQWELYLKHVVNDDPFPWDLKAGARGLQLVELALKSWAERRWVDVPEKT